MVSCQVKQSDAVVFVLGESSVFSECAANETRASLFAPTELALWARGQQACTPAVQKLTAIKENEGRARVLCKRIVLMDEKENA